MKRYCKFAENREDPYIQNDRKFEYIMFYKDQKIPEEDQIVFYGDGLICYLQKGDENE